MELNKYIDNINFSKKETTMDITKLCDEAIKYNFESVYISPCYIEFAKDILKDTNTLVNTVIGFPWGVSTLKTKQFEAVEALELGADEFDICINVGALKDKDYDYVKKEIESIRDVLEGKPLSVIVDISLLDEEEIIKIIEICNETFVNYINLYCESDKIDELTNCINIVNNYKTDLLHIKVISNINNLSDFKIIIEKGITRVGTINAEKIMKEWECK